MSNLNRRDFLKLAGKVSLGAAALTAVPAVVSAEETAAPAWPWKYEKLDVAEVQAAVFEHFSTDGGCAAGAVGGILSVLAKHYPEGPYDLLNSKMFADGAGGYGRQNLCGALGGSFAIFGLFLEGAGAKALQKELYAWYESTALPIYLPEGAEPHPAQSVAGSELCKDSYGNWSAKTGLAFGDPIRINRCRCLTADVAGKAVELLNAHFFGGVVEEAPAAPELAANEYIGVGKGFEGDVKVKVTMDGDKIAKIDVLEQKESMPQTAMTDIPARVIAAQSVEGIDVVSGSTVSSNALIEAIKDALSQIKK